jgi:hypothetical protein
MRVELLGDGGRSIESVEVAAPSEGTFAWQPLELSASIPAATRRIRVSLFLKALPDQEARGRVWFDHFEILPQNTSVEQLESAVEVVDNERQPAPQGARSLQFDAPRGVELVSVPFRVEPGRGAVQLWLRADPPQKVTIRAPGLAKAPIDVALDAAWQKCAVAFDLEKAVPDGTLRLQPAAGGKVWLDGVDSAVQSSDRRVSGGT